MLEVKLASQERRLPVSTVTSGEGAQSSPCTLIPLIRLTSRPPRPRNGPLLTAGGLCALFSYPPPSSRSSSPQATSPSPRPRRHTTPPAHSQFSLSTSPHLPQTVLSSHNLVPGICSEGAGLLSNPSGPTHPHHMRAVIGESQHPPPLGGRGGSGEPAGSVQVGAVWRAVPRKTPSGEPERDGRARAGPGDLRGPMNMRFVPCHPLFSLSTNRVVEPELVAPGSRMVT